MKNIGIIGAENSHAAAISKIINIEKKIRGFRVSHIWGEKKVFAHKTAEAGQIPEIVENPEQMIGNVDAVIVDHRHGTYHLPAAMPFLKKKIPLFIDKPFCFRVSKGRQFCDRAEKNKVPVCSFSVLPKQKSFKELRKKIKKLGKLSAVVTTGPCDIKSKYGGIFFYGIHQVDLILSAVGYDAQSVQFNRGKANSTGTIFFSSGLTATMNFIGEHYPPFHFSAIGDKGRIDMEMASDKNSYLTGVRDFTRMFRTGTSPSTRESMLMPVAVLEALEKSMNRKRKVRVGKIL